MTARALSISINTTYVVAHTAPVGQLREDNYKDLLIERNFSFSITDSVSITLSIYMIMSKTCVCTVQMFARNENAG